MAKLWDDLMKMLVKASPQQFVALLLPDAYFESERIPEMQIRSVNADLLYNVIWNGQKAVLHVEFQRRRDSNMGKRLWEYNALAGYISRLPVCSFVIYLKQAKEVVEPPYVQMLPNQEIVYIFYFKSIKLWEVPSDVLKKSGLEGMLPLLPLTGGGATREAVDDMITGLQAAGKEDLLPLGYAFAALIFEKDAEKQWLQGRFAKMHEILEESWAYQEMVEKGLVRGLEQGRKQAMEQAKEEEKEMLRLMLKRFVQKRFPSIEPLAASQASLIDGLEALQTVIEALFDAQTTEDARLILIKIGATDKIDETR